MVRSGIGIALGVLLASTAAQAQTVSNFTENASSSVTYLVNGTESPAPGSTFGETGSSVPSPGVPIGSFTASGITGSNFTSFVDNDGVNPITFESSDVASGQYVRAVSTNTVGFTFTNDTSNNFLFTSEITPAGLGFYMADVTSGCAYSSCPEVTGVSLTSLSKFSNADFSRGSVSFTFYVTDTFNEVTTDLFRASGSSAILNGVISDDFDDAATVLKDFYGPGFPANGFTYPDSDTAHTFSWSATPISAFMAPGVHHLSYYTQVSSFSNANPTTSPCGASLVAFAGFGDPIGQAGSIENLDSLTAFSACGPKVGGISGLNFTPETLKYSFTQDASVPEPATWAMMILGFGAIGATLRRRRVMGATV